MIRVALTILLPLLLPLALYTGWRLLLGRVALTGSVVTWIWLGVAGLLLASLTLVALNVDFGGARNGVYVAPHLGADGRVVPGHIEPAQPGRR
jgi:hypothetical protein